MCLSLASLNYALLKMHGIALSLVKTKIPNANVMIMLNLTKKQLSGAAVEHFLPVAPSLHFLVTHFQSKQRRHHVLPYPSYT
mmetsp:Transcript_33294/g.50224  ORF Transcript_33294/g.50224 Transcript_33294/m.50224 type:complete len:82 (-) Transcript_33294:5385-5630(-)